VALLGAPNVGKSTLTNSLVGAKVSIVTHKVQTTRTRIRGIAVVGASQVILVDTPGIFAPRRRLDRAMVEAAWSGARDADIVLVLIDAEKGIDEDAGRLLDGVASLGMPLLLALNKVDRVRKDALLALAQAASGRARFERVFMISALDGDGVGDLKAYLAQAVPLGPWLYPEDEISDAPLRHLAAEITREKLTLRLHDELPYASHVETIELRELQDGALRVEQTIYVERESQRKIVLGKGGQTVKSISMAARQELSELLERPVHLFLFVKVRERWGEDPERYREMGLDYPKE
jgi:GTP-binding protein Era